jgi:hypothetical protein
MILVHEHDLQQDTIQLVTALFILQNVLRMATFQTEIQNLLDRNAEYAKFFPGAPTIEQLRPAWKQGTSMMVCMCDFLIFYSRLSQLLLTKITLTLRFSSSDLCRPARYPGTVLRPWVESICVP